jgi:hypothetical protein
MKLTGKLKAPAALVAMLALAACQSAGGGGGGPVAAAPSGVEGSWVSADGVAISNFRAGRFETLAADTGNKLAEGPYTQMDQNTVQIQVTSIIRQTTTAVNCALVSPQQLNCTSSTGQQFSLNRRAGTV